MPRSSALRRAEVLVVAAPALLAGLLCAYQLGVRSLWLDESATISIASQSGHALWAGIAHDGGNMLAYYLLMHLVIGAFGDGSAVIRVPSLIGNVLTAALVALLALRLFENRRLALLAGALVGLSLPLVFWGQDARGYALMVTFSTGSFVALVEMMRAPASGPVPRWAAITYTVCLVIALYIGYDAILLVPAQLLLLWVFPERTRTMLLCLAATVVCCLPLAALAIARGSGQLFWVPPLTVHVLGQTAVTLFSTGMPPNFHKTITTTAGTILCGLLLVAAVVAAGRLWRGRDLGGSAWKVMLCVAWVVVPTVLGLIAAAAGKPIELARCTVLLMPGLSLLFAWALLHPLVPRYASIGGVIVLLALRVIALVPSYGTSPENWKAATADVLAAARTRGGCVMFYPQDGRMAFDYYARHDGLGLAADLTPVLPTIPWGQVKPYVEEYHVPSKAQLNAIVARCPRLWLISSHEGQSNGPRLSGEDYVKYERLVAALGWRYPSQRLKQYGYAAVVYVWQLSR